MKVNWVQLIAVFIAVALMLALCNFTNVFYQLVETFQKGVLL